MAICELDHLPLLAGPRDFALVGGGFDPLHGGHIDHFWEAQKYGPLVCAIAPDLELAAKHPPLIPEQSRARMVAELRPIHHVTIARTGIVSVLEALKPIAYVKGQDWVGRLPADEVAACERLDIPIRHTTAPCQSSTAYLETFQRRTNAEKLAAFETAVSIQPTPAPWTPVTDYSFSTRKAIEGPHAELIRDVLQPRTVFDAGCGPGHLVTMLRQLGMTTRGETWPAWNMCSKDAAVDRYADVVICREVLEHLRTRDVLSAIRTLIQISSRLIYVTTRFTAKSHLLDLDQRDDLDPTHVTLLNQDFLRSLFVLHGCTRRSELETAMDWQKKGRVLVYQVPS